MTGCQGRMEAQVTSEEGKKGLLHTTYYWDQRGKKNPKQTKGMDVYLIYESCFGEITTDMCLIKYL